MTRLGRILAWPFSTLGNLMLQPDKVCHLYWGMGMGLCALYLTWWLALLVVAIAAVLKEGYDFLNPPHQCELMDFIATMIGGSIAIVLIAQRLHHA